MLVFLRGKKKSNGSRLQKIDAKNGITEYQFHSTFLCVSRYTKQVRTNDSPHFTLDIRSYF